MPAPPDHDELRIRGDLRHRIDGAPLPPRPRDWLDEILDDEPMPRTAPPAPPLPPKRTATDTPGEPRWEWRRLLHWPYARLCCGAALALLPVHNGYSTATGWGTALRSCREQASIGAAWCLAGITSGAAVFLATSRGRATVLGWTLLTTAFIGTIAMASPLDIVTLITGVTK